MEARQYRIMKWPYAPKGKYKLVATFGLGDVQTLGMFDKQGEARAKAKAHAEATGVKPIILT
jgi:hypothetical protein